MTTIIIRLLLIAMLLIGTCNVAAAAAGVSPWLGVGVLFGAAGAGFFA